MPVKGDSGSELAKMRLFFRLFSGTSVALQAIERVMEAAMTKQAARRTIGIGCSVLMILAGAFATSASAQSRRYNGGITVFTNPNFTGQSVTFRDDTPDLRGYSLNDKISSLEITDGQSWEVCQDI